MALTLYLMVQRAYSVMTNEVLIAIPLFVFMGYLVERARLIERLFQSIHLALAWIPGSLAVATLVTSALFATATGIIGAVVTLMGLLALPAMLKAGYEVRLAAGTPRHSLGAQVSVASREARVLGSERCTLCDFAS